METSILFHWTIICDGFSMSPSVLSPFHRCGESTHLSRRSGRSFWTPWSGSLWPAVDKTSPSIFQMIFMGILWYVLICYGNYGNRTGLSDCNWIIMGFHGFPIVSPKQTQVSMGWSNPLETMFIYHVFFSQSDVKLSCTSLHHLIKKQVGIDKIQ